MNRHVMKIIREYHAESQKEFAARVGLSRSLLEKCENGFRNITKRTEKHIVEGSLLTEADIKEIKAKAERIRQN